MAISVLIVPASAADDSWWNDPDIVQDFFEWNVATSQNWQNNFWKTIYGDSWMADDAWGGGGSFGGGVSSGRGQYEEYLNEKLSNYGAAYFEDGAYWFYMKPTSVKSSYNGSVVHEVQLTDTSFSMVGRYNGFGRIYVNYEAIVFPLDGEFECYFKPTSLINIKGWDISGTCSSNLPSDQPIFGPGKRAAGDVFSYPIIYAAQSDQTFNSTFAGVALLKITPIYFEDEVTSESISFVGDYGIIGDDGTLVKVEGNTLINETDKSVYNPITSTQTNYTDCVFNFLDRSYTLTLEDGSTMKVVYGDENVTIQEGDTVYNVYYLCSDNGGSGSNGGGSVGSDNEIGDAVSGLLGGLGNILAGLIEGLLKMAAQAVEALGGLIDIFNGLVDMILGFFGGFTSFLGSMFPFLPEETFVILNFGLILLIAAAVIKKLFL